jgi:NADPH:quinone reductase-like Zn-dependent oxidoreductase
VARGEIRPIIDRVLPIQDAAQAHAIIQSNQTVGKVVLTMP